MFSILRCTWLAALMLIVPHALAQQSETDPASLTEVRAAIDDAWSKQSGFRSELHLSTALRESFVRLNTNMKGPLLVRRDGGGDAHYRAELTGRIDMGPFLKLDATLMLISDGDAYWTVRTARGNTTAEKRARPDTGYFVPSGGSALLDEAAQRYTLRVLRDGVLQARPVFIIEGRPRQDAEQERDYVSAARFYFDKASGVLMRRTLLDEDGRAIVDSYLMGLQLDPSFPDGIFTYDPPPGMTVETVD